MASSESNDLYGHSAGDRLLVDVAQRLKACVRGGDTVSRLGGDEFVLLFSGWRNVHECDLAIARIIATLTRPFKIDEYSIDISASIGVTLYPQDCADADTLLRHADQAMYAAKQAGRNRYHLFDPENTAGPGFTGMNLSKSARPWPKASLPFTTSPRSICAWGL